MLGAVQKHQAGGARSEGGTPGALVDSRVDHFQCYKAKISKGTPKLPKGVQALVENFFDPARTFDVEKPKSLCVAADKNGEGIEQPGARLLCFQAKPAKGEPKHAKREGVFVLNQLGESRLDTVKESELCVPALPPLESAPGAPRKEGRSLSRR